MKLAVYSVIAAFSLCAGAAAAKDLPTGGMTLGDVADWLSSNGYRAEIVTDHDGHRSVYSGTDGADFHVYMFDCKEDRCGSMQFSSGFSTKGALNAEKINEWDSGRRWGRAYVDKVNDPWIEYDVDLSPGGTYEMLNDEFAIWRETLVGFRAFIGWSPAAQSGSH